MPRPKKPEMVRPEPRLVVEGAGPAPKRKNPPPAKIVPDGENKALKVADGSHDGFDPFSADVSFGAYAMGEIAAGIRSLVAERDALKGRPQEIDGNPEYCTPYGWRRLEDGERRKSEDKYLSETGFWKWCEISQGRRQGSPTAKEVCIRRLAKPRT
jgi:hypothetical protein